LTIKERGILHRWEYPFSKNWRKIVEILDISVTYISWCTIKHSHHTWVEKATLTLYPPEDVFLISPSRIVFYWLKLQCFCNNFRNTNVNKRLNLPISMSVQNINVAIIFTCS